MSAGFRGAIFDVDGVLVDSPHERAWQDTLRDLMASSWRDIAPDTSYTPEAFTPRVYQDVVSGKPRMSGARAALEHFGIPDAETRAQEYAERKQEQIVALLSAGEFEAFPDALRFLLAVSDQGLLIAAASSSKNAGLMLDQIEVDVGRNIREFLAADLSGRDFEHGKPHPEIFLASAEALGLTPQECFVVEDAVSGVQAAKAGGMAALGVARADDADRLAAAGADLVVTSLDDVDRAGLAEGVLRSRSAGS